MPKEIKNRDEVLKLLPIAIEIRVVRKGDETKVKLRTVDTLYTFKTKSTDADALLKGTKAPIIEI